MSLVLIKEIIVYSFPVITLIGLITNTTSFVIFSRKKFQNTIFSTYFRFFITFQNLNLILPINKILEFNFNIYFSRISNFTCKLRNFYGYFNLACSAWLLVAISLDRYLCIAYPTRFLFRKKVLFQILACFIIIVFHVCYFVSSWFYYLKETRISSTNETLNQTRKIYKCVPSGIETDIMELFEHILIPFFLMILFTSLTSRHVFQSRKIVCSTLTTINNDRRFAISSITINILFVLFNLPQFLLNMINDYTLLFANHLYLLRVLQSITYFFHFTDLISIFFINYFVNSIFKKEFDLMIFNRVKCITHSN